MKRGPKPGYSKFVGMDRVHGKYTVSESGCWVWNRKRNEWGYGVLGIANRSTLAHRFVWTEVHGSIPEGYGVLHRCDNPACINPEHLFLGTPADNNADMKAKGRNRQPKGTAHPRARLKPDDIRRIRSLAGKRTHISLAEEYKVAESTIWMILHNRIWKSVKWGVLKESQ